MEEYRPTKKAIVESVVMGLILLGILIYCMIPSRSEGSYVNESLERAVLQKALKSKEMESDDVRIAKRLWVVTDRGMVQVEEPVEIQIFENVVKVKYRAGEVQHLLYVPVSKVKMVTTDWNLVAGGWK